MTGTDARSAPPALAVVIPAHDAAETIGECRDALIEAGFTASGITVVDDGSGDGTGAIARARGARVLRNESPQRPAEARNRGANAAGGEAILFVDADVRVAGDIRPRLLQHLTDPRIAGVIGSYDDAPRSDSTVGRYRNLLHAHTHQNAAGEVPTFWTGLGVIRRQAFEEAGGFLRAWENIEDVELGLRVTARGGRILLDPDIRGKHLKDWSLRSMVRTDMLGRAVPWTRLMRAGRMPVGVLSTTRDKRISAGAIALALLSVPLGLIWPAAFWLCLLSLVVFTAANAGLFGYLIRTEGLLFAVRAWPLHALHHIAGLSGYAKVMLLDRGPARKR